MPSKRKQGLPSKRKQGLFPALLRFGILLSAAKADVVSQTTFISSIKDEKDDVPVATLKYIQKCAVTSENIAILAGALTDLSNPVTATEQNAELFKQLADDFASSVAGLNPVISQEYQKSLAGKVREMKQMVADLEKSVQDIPVVPTLEQSVVELINTGDPLGDRARQAKAIISATTVQLRLQADSAMRTARGLKCNEKARIARHIEGRFRQLVNLLEKVYPDLRTLINQKENDEKARQQAELERITYLAKFRFTTVSGEELHLRYYDMWPFGSPDEYWHEKETSAYRLMRSDNSHRSDDGTITPLIPWLKKNITHALYFTASSDSDSDIVHVRYYGTVNAHIIREDGARASVYTM
jgi:hypothetical protein